MPFDLRRNILLQIHKILLSPWPLVRPWGYGFYGFGHSFTRTHGPHEVLCGDPREGPGARAVHRQLGTWRLHVGLLLVGLGVLGVH